MWHVIGHHWGPIVLLWDVICARLPVVIRIQCIAVCCWTMLDVTQLKCTVAMVCYARILQEFYGWVGLDWITVQGSSTGQVTTHHSYNKTAGQRYRGRNQDNTNINLAPGGQDPLYKRGLVTSEFSSTSQLEQYRTLWYRTKLLSPQTLWQEWPETSFSKCCYCFVIVCLEKNDFITKLSQLFELFCIWNMRVLSL